MRFLAEFVEWIACLTEGGLFYWLAGKTFREERKDVRTYWDCILTAVLAAVILGVNNIVLYSAFTLLLWMLLGSVSAMALYRVSYRKILSFIPCVFASRICWRRICTCPWETSSI